METIPSRFKNMSISSGHNGSIILYCWEELIIIIVNILSPSRWYQVPVMNPWPPRKVRGGRRGDTDRDTRRYLK